MIYKIVIAGIVVCLINIIIKKYFSEFVLPIEIVYIAVSMVLLIDIAEEIFSVIYKNINSFDYSDEIFVSMIKGAGLCLLTKFASDICLENSNKVIADVIEFTGRIMITAIALPYIEAILSVAMAFLR